MFSKFYFELKNVGGVWDTTFHQQTNYPPTWPSDDSSLPSYHLVSLVRGLIMTTLIWVDEIYMNLVSINGLKANIGYLFQHSLIFGIIHSIYNKTLTTNVYIHNWIYQYSSIDYFEEETTVFNLNYWFSFMAFNYHSLWVLWILYLDPLSILYFLLVKTILRLDLDCMCVFVDN